MTETEAQNTGGAVPGAMPSFVMPSESALAQGAPRVLPSQNVASASVLEVSPQAQTQGTYPKANTPAIPAQTIPFKGAAALVTEKLNTNKVGGEVKNPQIIVIASLKDQLEKRAVELNELTIKLTQTKSDGEKALLKATVGMQGQLDELRSVLTTKVAEIQNHVEKEAGLEAQITSLLERVKNLEAALKAADDLIGRQPNPFMKDTTAPEEEGEEPKQESINFNVSDTTLITLANNFEIMTSYMKWGVEYLNSMTASHNVTDYSDRESGENAPNEKINSSSLFVPITITTSHDKSATQNENADTLEKPTTQTVTDLSVVNASEAPVDNASLSLVVEALPEAGSHAPVLSNTQVAEIVLPNNTPEALTMDTITLRRTGDILIALGHGTGRDSLIQSLTSPALIGTIDVSGLPPKLRADLMVGTVQ